jgi:hypothetical protein
MDIIQGIASVFAVIIAAVSLWVAHQADVRAKKAEEIKDLLGEKEAVSFAALKLIKQGFPKDAKERGLVIDAVLQACVFEKADRARALLYRVIADNRTRYHRELWDTFKQIRQTFDMMEKYQFTDEEFNPGSGLVRLHVVQRVLEERYSSGH